MQTKVSLTFTNEIVFLHALQQFVYFAPFKILKGNTYDTRLYLYTLTGPLNLNALCSLTR